MAREPEWEDVETLEAAQGSAGPDLLGIALRRKWLIVLGAIVGFALGYLYYLRQSPIYKASAQVLVVRKHPGVLPIQGTEGQSFAPNDDYLSTHVVLLRSPVIIDGAVKSHDLQSLRSFTGGDAMSNIIGSLSVTRDAAERGGSNILNLSYRGPVADECGKVLNAVIDSYTEFLGSTYQEVSDSTLKLITEARDVLHKDLQDQWSEYLTFRQEGTLLWKGKEGSNIHQERLASIEGARSSLLLRRAETEGRLKAIEEALAAGRSRKSVAHIAARAVQSQSLSGQKTTAQTLDEQLFPLMLQEQMLLEDYGPDHPQVDSARKRIKFTRELMLHQAEALEKLKQSADDKKSDEQPTSEDELDLYLQSLKQELEESQVLEKSLTDFFEHEREGAKLLADSELKEEMLRNQLELTRQLYDGVIKRLQEINVVKDYGGYKTQIISPAGNGWQVEPNATRILTMAVFLGLLGGAGLGYVVDVTDKSFRTPEEIRKRLGLPVVGHIPFMKPRTDQEVVVEANGKTLDSVLCTYHRPKSRDSEAYRGVRTALYFSTRGEGHKVIQVTSPGPGDGKTTLAANLAVSIAQSGKRTLIIDADFRRPRVHKVFGLDSKVGLASVFLGEAEMADAIQQTAVPNLWALPCGPHPPNPAELLTSERFAEALLALREKYDFVVIDTPPLLVVTDPCAVAPRVDGVILTIRVSKNGRPDAERAKEILATLGAKVVGVVVNGVGDQGGHGYGRYGDRYGGYRYGQYGYGYGYGYGSPYGSNGSGGYGDDDGYYQSEDQEQEKTTEVETEDDERG